MTNELIIEYSNFIYGIAKNFNGYKNKEDLLQAGFMGLIMAYKNYKKENETKFTTYAYPYILGEMRKLVREDKGIKISKNITRLKTSIEKATNYLSQKYLRKPTNKEIANLLEITEFEVEQALKTINILQSTDQAIVKDGKELNLYDITPTKQLDIETLVSLKEALNSLDDDSKKLLMYSTNSDMTQQEIAEKFNTNQVQISRQLTKIKTNLRSKIAA